MKEPTYNEPVSDMAMAFASQAQSFLKCDTAPALAAGSVGVDDARPWAYQAHDEALMASSKAKDAIAHGYAAQANLRAAEAMENRSSDALRLGWEVEAANCAKYGAEHRKAALEHQRKAADLSPKKGLLKSLLGAGRDLLMKSQVGGYTKKDGTVVAAYNNKVMANAHPQGFAPGANVYHPHPQKPGKLGLGQYAGTTEDGKQSVVKHGDQHYALDHEDVRAASGVPGGSKKVAVVKKAKPKAKAEAAQAEKPGAQAKPNPSPDGKATGATPQQLAGMEDALANDEESSDEEMCDFFVDELGVTPEVAKQAVSHRDAFMSNATPETGLLAKLMEKDASGKGGSPDAGDSQQGADSPSGKSAGSGESPNVSREAQQAVQAGDKAAAKFGDQQKANEINGVPKTAAEFKPGDTVTVEGKEYQVDKPVGDFVKMVGGGAFKPSQMQAYAPAGGGEGGDVPPQGDANEAGWDQLPDDQNPNHALSGMSSKDLGRMATMKPEHAKAHAHSELAARGMSAKGDWLGFEQAKAHHSGDIPSDFTAQPGVAEHMQTVKGSVLTAAAGGHLDLQKRARHALASRGHDTQGNWVGFDKAKQMHLGGGKDEKGGDQGDLFNKGGPVDRKRLLFVAAGDADALRRGIGGGAA
jgi:hypothetical protein